jgi:hypothetical protein
MGLLDRLIGGAIGAEMVTVVNGLAGIDSLTTIEFMFKL